MSRCVNHGAVENKDIAINHDSIGQETVGHVDKVTHRSKEPAERTHSPDTESENSRNIRQAEETVGQEHPVEERQAVLLDGVLDQADIDDDNGGSNSNPKYLENSRVRFPEDEICFHSVESTKYTKLPAVHLTIEFEISNTSSICICNAY